MVSEFGRVCEIRMLIVNVGNSKVIRSSRYINKGRMHCILNGDLSKEVVGFVSGVAIGS